MDFQKILDETEFSCMNSLERIHEANQKCFADIEAFGNIIQQFEEQLNKRKILKFSFSKSMMHEGEVEYIFSIRLNHEGGDKQRIYLTIKDTIEQEILLDTPLMQAKVNERIKCLPLLKAFINDYADHFIAYTRGLNRFVHEENV